MNKVPDEKNSPGWMTLRAGQGAIRNDRSLLRYLNACSCHRFTGQLSGQRISFMADV